MFCTVMCWLSHCTAIFSSPTLWWVHDNSWLISLISLWKFVWLIFMEKKTVIITISMKPNSNRTLSKHGFRLWSWMEFNIICLFKYILLCHLSLTPKITFDRHVKTEKNRMVPIFDFKREYQIPMCNMDILEGGCGWCPQSWPSRLISLRK